MNVAAIMCSAALLMAMLLFGAFLWLTRARKCPRCGSPESVPLPHVGPFVVYCRKCLLTRNLAKGE